MSRHGANDDGSQGAWIAMCAIVGLLALLLLAGMVIAVPAEVGGRLERGHWLPLSLPILWRVLRAWLADPQGGAMLGWPSADRTLLPGARLYGGLLIGELGVLPLLVAAVIWGLIGVSRFWTTDKGDESREDALARARGRLGADGRAGTRGLRR